MESKSEGEGETPSPPWILVVVRSSPDSTEAVKTLTAILLDPETYDSPLSDQEALEKWVDSFYEFPLE